MNIYKDVRFCLVYTILIQTREYENVWFVCFFKLPINTQLAHLNLGLYLDDNVSGKT